MSELFTTAAAGGGAGSEGAATLEQALKDSAIKPSQCGRALKKVEVKRVTAP
jgi:hypothetical protein